MVSLPQGLPASKSVGRLRTFGVVNVKGGALKHVWGEVTVISLIVAESPMGIASLSSTAAGLLQSFFKSANEFLTSRKPSAGKVSACADVFMSGLDASPPRRSRFSDVTVVLLSIGLCQSRREGMSPA